MRTGSTQLRRRAGQGGALGEEKGPQNAHHHCRSTGHNRDGQRGVKRESQRENETDREGERENRMTNGNTGFSGLQLAPLLQSLAGVATHSGAHPPEVPPQTELMDPPSNPISKVTFLALLQTCDQVSCVSCPARQTLHPPPVLSNLLDFCSFMLPNTCSFHCVHSFLFYLSCGVLHTCTISV